MKKFVLVLLLTLSMQSCVTNYYYVKVNNDTPLYSEQSNGSTVVYTIPSGNGIYIKGKKYRKYRKIKYGNYVGWAYNPNYNGSTYYSSRTNSFSSSNTRSSSSSYTPSSSKTVNVKGYYRKNGTYVRPHTRSAPKRR